MLQSCDRQPIDFPVHATECLLTIGSLKILPLHNNIGCLIHQYGEQTQARSWSCSHYPKTLADLPFHEFYFIITYRAFTSKYVFSECTPKHNFLRIDYYYWDWFCKDAKYFFEYKSRRTSETRRYLLLRGDPQSSLFIERKNPEGMCVNLKSKLLIKISRKKLNHQRSKTKSAESFIFE